MRSFGVEEELLIVKAHTLVPYPIAQEVVSTHMEDRPSRLIRTVETTRTEWPMPSDHVLVTGLHQEQLKVVGPPVDTFNEQLEAIRRGRQLADAAATEWGARVVALASPLSSQQPHVTTDPRHRAIGNRYGLLAREQLSCGFHIHVEVDSDDEGIHVLDRIRVWLPVLLAMSANSPYWNGTDSSFASYRYQSWCRWPTAGPCEPYGSIAAYQRRAEAMIRSGAALDREMLHYDARLSEHYPTVEVRVADVCLDPRGAAALATLVRALVETAANQWRAGEPVPPVGAAELRARSWRAAHDGLAGQLMDPGSGAELPAEEVVAGFLDHVGEALEETGEWGLVVPVVADLLLNGTGADWQRRAYAERADLRDVVEVALSMTHEEGPPPQEPAAALMPRIA